MAEESMGLIESATSATYSLSPAGSRKLRRLTRAAGLSAENIISRLAIVESAQLGPAPEGTAERHGGKEIRGVTLLGKAHRGGALLVMLVASREKTELNAERLRTCINSHWERGISLLDARTKDVDTLTHLAAEIRRQNPPGAPDQSGARPGGLGSGMRDRVAAAVGRRHGRWPTEVRRLVAMAGRLDEDRALALAADLQRFALDATGRVAVSEGVALEYMESLGLNRLGLSREDRRLLRELSEAGGTLVIARLGERDQVSLSFLQALGLIALKGSDVTLGELAERLGEEVWA